MNSSVCSRELEGDAECSEHADGLTLETGRLVFPGLHRLDGGAGEGLVSADDSHAVDASVREDDDLQHHDACPSVRPRRFRIWGDHVAALRPRWDGIIGELDRAPGHTADHAALRRAALEASGILLALVAPDGHPFVFLGLGFRRGYLR